MFLSATQLVQAGENTDPDDVLKFCVFPNKSPKKLYSMYDPLLKRLSEVTGKKIDLVTAPDKQTFQQRALAGEYDLAVACVSCYFQLRDKRGFRAIVRGEPSFRGGVVVKKDSGLTNPLQLRGRKVAAMRKHSYAGFLFFRAYLAEHGVSEDEQPRYLFLDQLESVIYSVLNGQADGCITRIDALNSSRLARYKDQLQVILESIDIPQFPFIVSPELDPGIVRLLVEALTSFAPDDPAVKKLFQVMKINALHATSDADYKQFEGEYKTSMEIVDEATGN
jgi:phosphonate transport system substrate-binding protein